MVTDFNCSMNRSEPLESGQIICDLKLRYRCRQVCKPNDCFKEVFEISIEDIYYTANANDELKTNIGVYASTSLSTIIEYVAKISLIDYISYVLCCIGFWLGVSLLGSLLQFDLNKLKHNMSHLFDNISSGGIKIQNDNTHRIENIALRNQMHEMRRDMRIVKKR